MTPEATLLADAMLLVWDYRELCRKQNMPTECQQAQDLLNRYEELVMDNDE